MLLKTALLLSALCPVLGIPLEQINVPLVEMTDATNVPQINTTANSVFVSFLSNVRGTVIGTDANGAKYGYWALLFGLKAAFYAFLNQSVVDPVPVLAPADYQLLFVDENFNYSDPHQTSTAVTFDAVSRIFDGNNLHGTSFPPVRAAMGAWNFPAFHAQLAGALGLPAVGFADASSQYTDKDHYPTYMRTIPSTKYKAALAFLLHFGYTRVDDCTCDTTKGRDSYKSLAQELQDAGITLYQVLWPAGGHAGWPYCFGPQACWDSDAAKLKIYKQNVKLLKANNAHAHMFFIGSECPLFDILHYMALHGLAGGGHLWIGEDISNPYNGQYLPYVRSISAMAFGHVGPYAFVRPMDGYVGVRTRASVKKEAFWDFVPKLKEIQTSFLEPWLLQKFSPDIWTDRNGLMWRSDLAYPYYVFDGAIAILRSMNSLLLTKGMAFTNEEMLDELLNQDFMGVTGRIRFKKDTHERITVIDLVQYQIDYVGNDTGVIWAANFSKDADSSRRLQGLDEQLAEWKETAERMELKGETSPDQMRGASSKKELPPFPYGYGRSGRRLATKCSEPTDPSGMMAYLGCLMTHCEDMAAAQVSALTGGAAGNCAAGYAALSASGNACEYDLNQMSSSLPPGTPFWKACPGQCASMCASQRCYEPQIPTCTPAAGGLAGGFAALIPYFGCITTNLMDMSDPLVNQLSGGALTSCVAGYDYVTAKGGDCGTDLSTMLSSLPPNTPLHQVCPGSCASFINTCAVPTSMAPQDIGMYFACLKDKCVDADSAFVTTLSGGAVTSCAAVQAMVQGQGGDCDFDLNQLLTTLPVGTKLSSICGGLCAESCAAEKTKCSVPSGTTIPELVSYFSCLQGPCDDADSSLVTALTGGSLTSCAAAYDFLGKDCSFELNNAMSTIPPGVYLSSVCPGQCLGVCAASPHPNRSLNPVIDCRKKYCADASPTMLQNLTGGNVQDCAALYATAKQDCNFDVTSVIPSLGPAALPLYKVCAEKCNCEEGTTVVVETSCPWDKDKCDFHAPGVDVAIAEYELDITLDHSKIRFYDKRTQAPPNLDSPCVEGQRYNVIHGTCEDCKVGFFTSALAEKSCEPCPKGTYSDQVKTSQCRACMWGTFSDADGSTACKNCSPGKFTDEPLKSECLSCNPGTYAPESSNECTFCEEGKYQNASEQSACLTCESFIPGSTSVMASKSSADCQCRPDTYYRPMVGCQSCVKGLTCNGGNDFPIQAAGFNAFLVDARTRHYEVFECTESDWCPGGEVSKCKKHRVGRSCAVLSGQACPKWMYTILPVCFLSLAYFVYRIAEHSTYGRVTSVVILAGNISIALVAMQAVNVYMNFFQPLPEDLQWMQEFTQLFMLQFNMVFPECNYGESFSARYSVSIWPPLLVFFAFCTLAVLTSIAHRIIPRWVPFMKLDATINTVGMIVQVMYVMQCKDAFAYFNTKDNPSNKETLVSFPDVIFASDVHFGPGPILITIYLWGIYVIGTYSVFVWVVVNARTKIHDSRFTARFRFVLARWRPECWFWGLFMLARNLGIALIPICVRSDRVFQTLVFILLLMAHALAEARYLPWRATINATFEIITSMLLTVLMVGGLIFDRSTTDGATSPEEKLMAICMAGLFGGVWLLILISICYALHWGSNKHKAVRREERFRLGTDLLETCSFICKEVERDPVKQKEWKSFIINRSGDYDEYVMVQAANYLNKFSRPDPLRRDSFRTSISRVFMENLDEAKKPPSPPNGETAAQVLGQPEKKLDRGGPSEHDVTV